MLSHLRPAAALLVLATLSLGLALPLGFAALGSLVLANRAGGSIVMAGGHPVGASLIGQNFTTPGYFHPRPSAITNTDPKDPAKTVPAPYDASMSAASNLGPTAKALVDRVRGDLPASGGAGAAADAVTSSASGLDPDISPHNAQAQVARVAAARHLAPSRVADLVRARIEGPDLGLLGAPHVNVLELNLALDRLR